ncbi:MAG: LPS-assembly lipoprotein [Candidatus Tokpelaia sp. JSC161]|jgi:LPS-assembly lipoprotein|nr:MAG: LPS-assembly lipoprotein [Candidatus Tokpelaia sp. JSC161]
MKTVLTSWSMTLCVLLASCTFQPLYLNESRKIYETVISKKNIANILSSISIESAHDQMTQLVRNHLIFLGLENLSFVYQLTLNIRLNVQQVAVVNDANNHEGRASAGVVFATSDYIIKDLQGKTLFLRKCFVRSSFDRPEEEYAAFQAEEDAKRRAAKELAERIFLSLVQDFIKG